MNLLVISEYFYPRLAGGELSLWALCTALASRGYKISVITSRVENTEEYEVIHGIEIYRPFPSDINSIIKRIYFSIKLYTYLKGFLKDSKINMIYNLGYVPTLPATSIASKYNIPAITSIESLPGRMWFGLTNPFLAFFNYVMELFVIRFGKHSLLRFPSEYTKNRAAPHTRSETAVIYNSINVDEIKEIKSHTDVKKIRECLGIEDCELFLLFVGLLTPVKNATGLITALSKSDKKFKLVLVGEGPERGKIERLIEKVGLDGKVSLLGKKPHNKTLSIIYSCDVLILPSKLETFSNVVLEGLALGKPVISTKVGAVPKMKSENLYLIDTLEDINHVLEKNIEPKKDDRVLEEYSMDKIIDEFEKLFKDVVINYETNRSYQG